MKRIYHNDDRVYVEYIPETFDELKELCKKLEGKGLVVGNSCIDVATSTLGYDIEFWYDGTIFIDEDVCFAENRTPQQMWNIIKSLVEE